MNPIYIKRKLWLLGGILHKIKYNYIISSFPLLASIPSMPPTLFQIPGPFSLIVIVTNIYKTQTYIFMCISMSLLSLF